jgi:DNA-binding transcriptional ArsR family regulator
MRDNAMAWPTVAPSPCLLPFQHGGISVKIVGHGGTRGTRGTIMHRAHPHHFDEHRTMPQPDLANLAAVLAEPSRAVMLAALMDGRALTATELAATAQVSAPTASSHLARLTGAGLLTMIKQGRHRYFRIANEAVAQLAETLMAIAAGNPPPAPRTGPSDQALRRARVCYDHLAGELGVQLLDGLLAAGHLSERDGTLSLLPAGERWCVEFGIDLPALRRARRTLCRACLDWSERRTHLSGAIGAAIMDRMLARGWVRRQSQGRALVISPAGVRFIQQLSSEGRAGSTWGEGERVR